MLTVWSLDYCCSSVDWAVADMLAMRQGSIGHIRYILKDSLKYLPFYGPYFQQVFKFVSAWCSCLNFFTVCASALEAEGPSTQLQFVFMVHMFLIGRAVSRGDA
jgi:hypothetical protein